MNRSLLLCSLLGVLVAGQAHADDVGTLLEQGIKAFGMAQLPTSRQLLLQAKAATSEPKVLARIHLYLGLVDAVEGATVRARAEFTKALGHDPTLSLDAGSFKKELVDLFDSVRRNLKGKISVTVAPRDARVIIDGKERGAAPLEAELKIGRHTVQVKSADGRSSYTTEVEVKALIHARVAARLEPQQGRISVRTSPAGASVTIDGKVVGRTPLEHGIEVGKRVVQVQLEGHQQEIRRVEVGPEVTAVVRVKLERAAQTKLAEPTRRSLFGGRLWTWVTAGAALATLGTGIGLGVSSNSDFASWEENCWDNRHPDCNDVADTVRTKDKVANIMFGVAGALAVSSVVLYFVEGRQSGEKRTPTLSAMGGAAGGSLAFSF